MRSLAQYRENVQQNGQMLAPGVKVTVQKIIGDFLRQLKTTLPDQLQFQQGMTYATDIMTGKDPRSQIIMRTVLSQPTQPTGAANPAMPINTATPTPIPFGTTGIAPR